MRVQVLLLVFCSVAHGTQRKTRSFLGGQAGGHGGGVPPPAPSPSYGAPAAPSPLPPSPPPPSYYTPQAPAPFEPSPPAPSPSYSAPTPEIIPEQPPALYSPPGFSAPVFVQEAVLPPAQDYAAPSPVQPVQEYAAPPPVQPAQDYAAPPPVQPAQDYAATSPVSSSGSIDQVSLSSAQTIEGQTLIDGKIQSILSQGSTQVETGSKQGYSYNAPPQSCQAGETLNSNGMCEKVTTNTNYYLFDVPEAPEQPLPPTQTAEKRVHYNVLLVRVPTQSQTIQNVNLSRDEQKTLVYVVRDPPKKSQSLPAPVTEAYKPESPAVFYVTPEAKASSEEVEHTGYGNTPDRPSPPSQGYTYNPPSGF